MRKREGHIDMNVENRNDCFLVIFPGIVTAIPIGKEELPVPASPVGHLNVSLVETPE